MNKEHTGLKAQACRSVLTERYDLAGNGILRTFFHQVYARVVPLGNYRGGAGLRCLLVLSVLHSVGQPIFRVLIRYERHLSRLYRLLERVRGKR